MKFRYAVPLFAAIVIAGTVLANLFMAPPAYGQHLTGTPSDFVSRMTCAELDTLVMIAEVAAADEMEGRRAMGLALQAKLCSVHVPVTYVAIAVHGTVFIDAPGAGAGIIVEGEDNGHHVRFTFLFGKDAEDVKAKFAGTEA